MSMSITNLFSEKLAGIRFWADTLAVLENPAATPVARADAAKVIFVDDPAFWAGVVEMTSAAATPVVAQPQALVPAPKPEPKKSASTPAKQQTQNTNIAPARVLEASKPMKTDEERRDQWLGILESFAGGGRIDFDKTSNFGSSILESDVVLNAAHWGVIFAAMQFASEKRVRLFDKTAYGQVLDLSPVDLLYSFVFGQDGTLDSFKAALASGVKPMSPQLVGQGYALVGAIDALDRRMEERFRPGDDTRVDFVAQEVERLEGPAKLISALFGEGEGKFFPDPAGKGVVNSPKVKGNILKIVAVKPGANGIPLAPNGIPELPLMAAETAVATEAASVN